MLSHSHGPDRHQLIQNACISEAYKSVNEWVDGMSNTCFSVQHSVFPRMTLKIERERKRQSIRETEKGRKVNERKPHANVSETCLTGYVDWCGELFYNCCSKKNNKAQNTPGLAVGEKQSVWKSTRPVHTPLWESGLLGLGPVLLFLNSHGDDTPWGASVVGERNLRNSEKDPG